jgi:hypothetical protein
MTTQVNVRPRKLLLGNTVPNYIPIKIKQLLLKDEEGICELDRINMKPAYQRDFYWNETTASGLIDAVMTNSIIPGLLHRPERKMRQTFYKNKKYNNSFQVL